jgi:hypothetical protein
VPDEPVPRIRGIASPVVERALVTTCLGALFLSGYFGVGLSRNAAQAIDIASTLDARLPFVAAMVWVYLWVFPAALLPLFVVRCRRLFRRTALAYVIAMLVSFACFAAYPVSSLRLRVSPGQLDPSRLAEWVVSTVYRLDPPYNLFPSLHLSIAMLAACSVWQAKRPYGAISFAGVGAVAVAVCLVKQHFLVDAVAGILLAGLIASLILMPWRAAPGVEPAYRWQGPAAFLALLTLGYGAVYVAYTCRN